MVNHHFFPPAFEIFVPTTLSKIQGTKEKRPGILLSGTFLPQFERFFAKINHGRVHAEP